MSRTARILGIASPILIAAHLSGCSDDVSTVKLTATLATESAIDFGDVQRGIRVDRTLEVKNTGSGVLDITSVEFGDGFSSADYEFKLSEATFSLNASQTKVLTVSFQPFADQEEPVTSWFRFSYDGDGDGESETFTVNVSGRGVTSGLIVEPDPVDFGTVLIGSSRTVDVRITNALSVPVDVRTSLDGITNQGGLGRFELLSSVASNGSLLADGELLAAGQSITVQVRYVPDPSQENEQERGRWILTNCDNPLCERRVDLLGRGTNAAVECDPTMLDFGDVNPGATTTRATRCMNVASESVTITGWRLEAGSAGEYEVEVYNGSPAQLAPGQEFTVEVAFSPTIVNVGRTLQAALEITGRNPRANRDLTPARIPITGKAGGPDIAVTPSSINFGQIALGTTGQRRVLIENQGYSDLTVSMINPDLAGTGLFTADRQAFSIAPGASEVLTISFSPTAEGEVMTQVLITSDDSDEPEVRVDVRAEGLDLPPCAYTLSPTAMNFGIVQVLRSTTQGFRIDNVGSSDCLVNDLALAPGSSEAFSLLAGEETGVRIPAGQSKTVIVEYDPPNAATHTGSIPFYISNPMNSNPEVTLRGVGSESALLISPNEVDFGQVGVDCSTRNRAITIYNTGSQATVIERIEIPAGVTNEFQIDSIPAGVPAPPGATIQPGQSIEFTVRYHANDLGQDTGFLHIFERGATDPYVVPLYGAGATNPVNEDRFTQLETPEVDILFVIDNSCSMADEQASLTSNFQSFIQFADAQALNYQISVVSTDVDGGFPGPSCPNPRVPQRPAMLSQAACGYFADGNHDNSAQDPAWRIVTPDEQPSPEAAFSAIATQGINGSGLERGLEAAYLALSSPLITGWNQGFLRPDAYLALIFVSDEEDQSPQSIDFYVDFFRAIKGFRNANLFSASAIVIPPTGCPGSGGFNTGHRYIEVANRTGGIVESICTASWAQALQNLGLSVFGYKSRFFLSNQPVAGTVEVWVDGMKIDPRAPSGQIRWSYDSTSNSVNFAPLAIPEPGSDIVVRYLAECL